MTAVKKRQKKTRVLFVMLQLNAGGSEKIVLNLAQHIDKSVFDVYVAAFSGGELYGDFCNASTKIFHVKKMGGFDIESMLKISAIVRDYSIDVINPHHYSSFVSSYLGAKILNNRSLVYTEHSLPGVTELPFKHEILCKMLFCGTNAIIGVSNEICTDLEKEFPSSLRKIFYIPNGVDIDLFQDPVDSRAVRAEFGISSKAIVIGTVANFRKVKNHICLIKAFHILSQKHPLIRLLLVGSAADEDPENSEPDIIQLIRDLDIRDRVIFAGYRDDIPLVLRSFDIFCLPSFSEGLPVSILEAMAAQIPVVGSNVRGIREVISSEDTGLLFPVNDYVSLATAIERLINDVDLRFALRTRAFEYVKEHHSMRRWINKYQKLFQSTQ